jgi:hypothetical protein
VAKRKTHTVNLDEKYTGAEPRWEDALTISEAECDKRMRRAFFYYNYYYSYKDLKPDVVYWLKKQPDVNKELLSKYLQSSDVHTPVTAGALARCWLRGMPFTERHTTYLMKVVTEAASKVRKSDHDEVAPVVTKKLTVQDHLRAQADQHVVYFEDLEDQLITHAGKVQPNAISYLRAQAVPTALITRIRPVFQKRRDELAEAQAGTCAQLAESYAHFKARDYKRYLEFYDSLLADFDAYGRVKRATKTTRVRKPVDRVRLVKNLKFLKSCPELKVTSIQPQDIVGANTLWVYNTKNRKLGKYVAEDNNTLGVRGSTILGYDPVKSVSKSLRKPEQQLAEFLKAGKIALRKFLDDIRAVEVELNGRINKNMLLLRIQ